MGTKKPAKKTPAKAGADPSDRSADQIQILPKNSLVHSEEERGLDGLAAHLNARRPFKLSEKERIVVETAISGFVDAASKGRSVETQELLKACASYLRAGFAPPEPANSWLVERLEDIAAQDAPWGVPLVSRKPGQKNADDYWIQLLASSYYQQLRREGEKAEVAKRIVAEKLSGLAPGLTPAKVESYARKLGK